jgi:hypothetical protein
LSTGLGIREVGLGRRATALVAPSESMVCMETRDSRFERPRNATADLVVVDPAVEGRMTECRELCPFVAVPFVSMSDSSDLASVYCVP